MSDSFNMINVPGDHPEFKDLYVFHGKSAYQAAVEYGFKGTEEEWVETMTALVFGTMESFSKKNPRLIYIDLNTDNIYRYDLETDKYRPIGGVLGETEDTAYRGDRGKIAYDHSQSEHVALDHKHNTSDIEDFEDQRLDIKVVDIITGTDLNEIVDPNMYRGDHVSDILNSPIEDSTRFKLEVYDGGSDTRIQVYMGIDNLSYYRVIQLSDGKYESTILNWRLSGALYEHPESHPASMIIESANRRFVSDAEKEVWNSAEQNAKDYTDDKVNEVIGEAPESLNTLGKIAEAIGDDPNFAENIESSINEALQSAKEYTDEKITDNLKSAKSYADQAEADALAAAKTYSDDNLKSAKSYADQAEADALAAAKAYADQAEADAVSTAKEYSDKNLATAKTYSDNNLKSAKSYADQAEADAVSTAKKYIDDQISVLTNAAPDLLNTLDELAAALGDDPNFATTMTNALAKKADKTTVTSDIAAALATAKTYSDNNLESAKAYADQAEADALAAAKSYSDNNLKTAKSYTDTQLKNYVKTSDVIGVSKGGTGVTTFTDGEVLIGNGTDPITTRPITSSVTNGSTSLITSGGVYSALSNRTIRRVSFSGSDTANTAGWYKVASQDLSSNSDIDIVFSITSTYNNLYTGILYFHARNSGGTMLTPTIKWLTRYGYKANDVRVVYTETTWTMYVKLYASQWGRTRVDVLSESSRNNKNANITLHSSTAPETPEPSDTYSSSDGGIVDGANKLNITAAIGSATQPVYFNANGVPVATTYTLGKSVPSGAIFTDKNVEQNQSTTSNYRPLLLGTTYDADPANLMGTVTGSAYMASGIYAIPSSNTIVATTFKGALSGNATSATKATKDSADQQINKTYIKGLSNSNNVITYTKGDGTTGTLTLPTYSYTLPVAGTALGGIKSGGDITVDSSGTVSVKDNSHLHNYMSIADLRDASFAPSNFTAYSMSTFFRMDGMPSSGTWYSGISLCGWTSDYASWQLAGNSHNTDNTDSLYYRNGRNNTWQAWREILDSVNYGNYALPLSGGKKITGSVSFGDVKLYPESNSTGSLGDSTHVWYNMYSTNATINNITATTLKTNGYIFGYRYSQGNDLPAFILDKPGSNYSGIGACGLSDTIYFSAVNSDGMTWNKTYKQKWLFNGTISADSYSNDPLMPFQVKTALNFVNRGIAWNANSYYEHVILLLPVLTATNWYGLNYIDGKFLCWKEGGNVYDVVEVNMNHVYNTLEYNIESYGQNGIWELCRCKYNGVDYYALKCPYHANPYTRVEFTGKIISALTGGTDTVALPLDVAYYNQNTSTVLNSEVNSSLTTTLTTSIVTAVNHRAKTLTGGINLVSKVQTGADQSGNAVYGSMYNTITGVSISMNGITISGGTSGGIITANNQIISNNVMSTKEFYASKKIVLTETGNILLRPGSTSYTAGIGYDTNGNECIALWAKNTVTRLRWYAGTDMSTLTAGKMMGITPDFEVSKATGTAEGYIRGQKIIHTGNYSSYLSASSTAKTLRDSRDAGTDGLTRACGFDIYGVTSNLHEYTDDVGFGLKFRVLGYASDGYDQYGYGPIVMQISNLSPASNNASDLGTSSYRWKNVYCSTGAFNGSDRKIKKDINYNLDDRYFKLFDNLKICTFKYKAGTSGRTHVGVIAQDLIETMNEINLDTKEFAGVAIDHSKDQETTLNRNYYDLYCGFNNSFYQEIDGAINKDRKKKRETLTYDVHYRDSVSIFDREQRFLIIKTDAEPEDYKKINEEYPDLTIHSIKLTSNDENVEDYIINLHNHIAYDPEYHSVEFEYIKDGSLHIIPKERYDGIGIALREDRELIDLSMYDNIVIDITYSDEFILGANYHEYDIYHEMSEEEKRIYMVRWGEIAALNVMKTQEHTKRITELEDEVRELKATINDLISIIKNNNLMS